MIGLCWHTTDEGHMQLCEILSPRQIAVANTSAVVVRSKTEALRQLAELLAFGSHVLQPPEIETALVQSERSRSSGIGAGVAIPHAVLNTADRIGAAILICPHPIDFDAVDGAPVSILVALLIPRSAAGNSLKAEAYVSRLFGDPGFRARLLVVSSGIEAYQVIAAQELAAR